MRPAYISLLLITFLGACDQDSYKIRTYGDAKGGNDGNWVDAEPIPDTGPRETGPDVKDIGFKDVMSHDACLAIPEACNGQDDNCNNKIDEGFDKLTDPRYCEECKGCMWLLQQNAYPDCKAGLAAILAAGGRRGASARPAQARGRGADSTRHVRTWR